MIKMVVLCLKDRSCPMETRRSWVQPLHSTMPSSELRDMYKVYNKEVRNLGFEPKT